MILAVCDRCARLLPLDPDGRLPTHDLAGPVVRQMTRKRRQCCPGSGKPPRRRER